MADLASALSGADLGGGGTRLIKSFSRIRSRFILEVKLRLVTSNYNGVGSVAGYRLF